MSPGSQAGLNHGLECIDIRAGAMQHYHYIFECLFDLMRIVQIENPAFYTQFSRKLFEV